MSDSKRLYLQAIPSKKLRAEIAFLMSLPEELKEAVEVERVIRNTVFLRVKHTAAAGLIMEMKQQLVKETNRIAGSKVLNEIRLI